MSITGDGWLPLDTIPEDRAMHVNIQLPSGEVNSWRWLPYKNGSQPPYIGGRWQIATEYSFKNETLPKEGWWKPNPSIKRTAR
jgi:hypothetical protein